jgi:hypothetical protein
VKQPKFPLDVELAINIQRQPDDTTCGPTCLHAIYRYYDDDVPLKDLLEDIHVLEGGGTLAVFLACHALARGYKATIYTFNLQIFDPTWFADRKINIADKLKQQAEVKTDRKLHIETEGYLEFLSLGGILRFKDLNRALIRGLIRRQTPILAGLSSTFLYRSSRLFGADDHDDDIRGNPCGHFLLLSGYHRANHSVMVSDPYTPNLLSTAHDYWVNIDRLIGAILLGTLTQDANLLVLTRKQN